MPPAMHHGRKANWEELRWDQDIGRWVGPRRDEAPADLDAAYSQAGQPEPSPGPAAAAAAAHRWHLGDH